LKNQLKCHSQNFLSVLFSILNDSAFLELSDIGILRALQENDKNSIPNVSYQCSIKFLIDELKRHYNKNQKQENQIVKNLGGLYVIGTERNNSRRIDNQLRGRCGRQGDPGKSRFFLSLDDDLFRLFGSSDMRKFMQDQFIDDEPLELDLLTKSLNAAQKRVEEQSYDARKYLYDYDDVLNKQRNVIYLERAAILRKKSLQKHILGYGEQMITNILIDVKNEKDSMKQIISSFEHLFGKRLMVTESIDPRAFKQHLFNEFWLTYQSKINELAVHGDGMCENLERNINLVNIDIIWREHLQEMTLMREAVGWRGYGQQNPLYEYKKEALKFFGRQTKILRFLVIYQVLRSSIL
jgi:preprotein translocase subunit SecA